MERPNPAFRFPDGSMRRMARDTVLVLLAVAAIATRSNAAAPDTLALRLPADAVFDERVRADSAVVFRHGTHVALASHRCTPCHPGLFRILAPTTTITHREMNAGRSCGSCHDGQHAFDVKSPASCGSCHVGRVAAAAAAARGNAERANASSFRGPKPIHYSQGEVSPGPVTFDHASHAKGACAACHPKLFAMKSSAAKPRPGMHERSACGACHDGKKSFGVEDGDACGRCHREGAR